MSARPSMMRKRGYEQQPFTQRDEWTWANAVRNTCTNIRRLHKHEHRQARKTAPRRNFPGGANRSNTIGNEAVTPQRVAVETFLPQQISLTQRKRRLQPIGLLNSKGGVYTPHPWTSKGGDTSANLANQTDQTSNVASNVKRWVEISHNTCVERVCWIKYNSIVRRTTRTRTNLLVTNPRLQLSANPAWALLEEEHLQGEHSYPKS